MRKSEISFMRFQVLSLRKKYYIVQPVHTLIRNTGKKPMKPIKNAEEIIRNRTSMRTYEKRPIPPDLIAKITQKISRFHNGPFGSKLRFQFVAATESDSDTLKGLGTYGIIQNPAGFVIGAVDPGLSGSGLVDFGYAMESIVLFLADLGLGTCWLGGSFRKSRFAERMNLHKDETVPAVISVGYPASSPRMLERFMRYAARSNSRKPWEVLFFRNDFHHPLFTSEAGEYASALEMVRLAPSASNRQPWRVVFESAKRQFHFFLQRSKGYRPEKLGVADLPRVDVGIALCHFEMTVGEAGFSGEWVAAPPEINRLPPLTSYVVSWKVA
ncbi:MAG: nitroreductase family protein [Phycisphaerae bacterium]|nr:nitroreductase family protein [Phycisphaerae bacterium]